MRVHPNPKRLPEIGVHVAETASRVHVVLDLEQLSWRAFNVERDVVVQFKCQLGVGPTATSTDKFQQRPLRLVQVAER